MSAQRSGIERLTADQKRELLARLLQTKGPAVKTYPLSYAQQRLWFIDQLTPRSPHYHQYLAERLAAPVDKHVLQSVVNEIVRRHDSLRTTFRSVGGRPIQLVAPSTCVPVEEVDLRALPEAERESEAMRLAEIEIRRPFQLKEGPLIRTKLLRLGEMDQVFVLTLHHIISDGWSLNVFFKELGDLYTAFESGAGSPLAPLTIQYPDFALWQRQHLQGDLLERQLGYWKRKLEGAPALDLPTDRPRAAVPSLRGGFHRLAIPSALTSELKALGLREGATTFMTLLAAFQVLLGRWSGQEDVVVGVPVANRSRAELEPLIGFFTNTLVMRADLSGDPSFTEFLQRVKETALGAYAHQDLPFEKLVEELQPGRDLSRNPLFQVTFQLFNPPDFEESLSGERNETLEVTTGTALFDLVLNVFEAASGLDVQMEYAMDLFDPDTVAGLAEQFLCLLGAIAANPQVRIWDAPLLTSTGQHRMLVEWNDTAAVYPRGLCVHEAFERRAARNPDSPAVCFRGQCLTYGALNAWANRLAQTLRARGVGPGVSVAVLIERSPELVVALLAVLKAGGSYVPLDPAYPRRRLDYIAADSGSTLCLTRETVLEAAAVGPEPDMLSGVSSEHLAYIIYTSGSTGVPKGVEVCHRSIMNLVSWHQRTYSVTAADIATQLASPAFDACGWELWPYLLAGACVSIPDDETRGSPPGLVRWMADEGVTVAFLPTPLAESVLEGPWPPHLRLRALLTGGDRLRGAPRNPLPFRLFNHYGPTEFTVVSTSAEIDHNPGPGPPPAIGRPIDNTRVFVLDRRGNPVPSGFPGELYIAGDGLARGYHGCADLTAARFVPNPWGAPGERMYRTGDRVRFSRDGALQFLGRTDEQIKIRGFRIEAAEIERALREHESVLDAAVAAVEHPRGEKMLAGYFVPAGGPQPAERELKLYLQQRLPEYMVPSRIVPVERLPLSPNGKLDRSAIEWPREAPETDCVTAPRTHLETALSLVWCEALGLQSIGVDTNFFDAGGHSLLIVRVQSKITETLGAEVSIIDLFRFPTIAALAQHLDAASDGNALPDIERNAAAAGGG
jgi:amino acid adenylation domain-containing protein